MGREAVPAVPVVLAVEPLVLVDHGHQALFVDFPQAGGEPEKALGERLVGGLFERESFHLGQRLAGRGVAGRHQAEDPDVAPRELRAAAGALDRDRRGGGRAEVPRNGRSSLPGRRDHGPSSDRQREGGLVPVVRRLAHQDPADDRRLGRERRWGQLVWRRHRERQDPQPHALQGALQDQDAQGVTSRSQVEVTEELHAPPLGGIEGEALGEEAADPQPFVEGIGVDLRHRRLVLFRRRLDGLAHDVDHQRDADLLGFLSQGNRQHRDVELASLLAAQDEGGGARL